MIASGQDAMNDRLEPRIRILLGSSIAIGPGKAALLEAIGETGSIAAAGRHMGMSYAQNRRAWGLRCRVRA
jgi:molybdate transport system regulatory protein